MKSHFVCISSLKYLGTLIKRKVDTSQLGWTSIRIAKITGQVAEFGILPSLKYNGLYFR